MGDTEAPKDILAIVYSLDPDHEWEKDLVQRCDGKLEVRWVKLQESTTTADGTHHDPSAYDREVLRDATMLFTYAPLPDGECAQLP